MKANIALTNRPDKQVVIDQHIYDQLAADPKLKKLNFFNRLRAHSSGYAFFQFYLKKVNDKQVYETIYLHKLIAERFVKRPASDKALLVRFIDGNKLNATLANLEWVTMPQLRRHMKGGSKATGYRGVTPDRGRYRAAVYHASTVHDLGHFDTPEQAALAYNRKSRELFGETKSLNVVLDHDGNAMKE